jgi:hypothetical protein
MSRFRSALVPVVLFALMFAALPGPGRAQRDAEAGSSSASSANLGEQLVGTAVGWGLAALSWLQAVIAPEHGGIVPATPPGPTGP